MTFTQFNLLRRNRGHPRDGPWKTCETTRKASSIQLKKNNEIAEVKMPTTLASEFVIRMMNLTIEITLNEKEKSEFYFDPAKKLSEKLSLYIPKGDDMLILLDNTDLLVPTLLVNFEKRYKGWGVINNALPVLEYKKRRLLEENFVLSRMIKALKDRIPKDREETIDDFLKKFPEKDENFPRMRLKPREDIIQEYGYVIGNRLIDEYLLVLIFPIFDMTTDRLNRIRYNDEIEIVLTTCC